MLKFSRYKFPKVSNSRRSARQKKPHGFPSQTLTEFAIILPLILLVIFVILEIARLMHAWLAIENGARFGVRYAVTGEFNPDFCPLGGCVSDLDYENARIKSIHETAWAGSSSILRVAEGEVEASQPSFFKVSVCQVAKLVKPDPSIPFSSYQCLPSEDGGAPGERVMVVVEFNHPVLSPLISSIAPQLRLSAQREAIVEGYRTIQPDDDPPHFEPPTRRPTNTLFQATATKTATITPTITPTPTPDCNLIRVSSGLRFQGEDLVMRVRNDNPMTAFLIRSGFHGRNVSNSPPAYLDWLSFAYSKYHISKPPLYLNPSVDVVTSNLWLPLRGGSSSGWRADFDDASELISGDFAVDLIFKFENWPDECLVTDAAHLVVRPTRTPRPTSTPGPTRTPRATNTPGPSPTPKSTRTPIPTRTPVPTNTPGPTPTTIPTKTNTPIPTSECSPGAPPD